MLGKLPITIAVALTLGLGACATNVVADKSARFDVATAAYDSGDYPKAYSIWSELADEDDLAAMRNAGQMLRQGKGVEKNSVKAFKLFREAADKGLVTAMANVADMYYLGEGTDKSIEAAVGWYTRAATAGLSIAQMKLAEFYEQGIGVEKSNERARALLERAARNGYAPARAKLAAMGGGTVSNTPIPDGPALKSAARMSPGDPINVDIASAMPPGDMKLMNSGFDAYAANDKAAAFAAWRAVAERGNPEAQLRLGLLYARGEGTPQDMIEAYRWLKLSANQGQPKAVVELGHVSKALAPSERAIAESLVKASPNQSKNAQ
jgi:hypothetical protein